MKPLKFINFAKTALLFCCALPTVALLSEQATAQTVNHDLIDRTGSDSTINQELLAHVSYDLMTMFAKDAPYQEVQPASPGVDYTHGMANIIMPNYNGVLQMEPAGSGWAVIYHPSYSSIPYYYSQFPMGQTCDPGPIGCINCGATMPTVYIPLENRAAPKQIPDSVTIGKVAPVTLQVFPVQLK